ncbi:MAG: hypothetical protein ACE5GM_03285 [bacterium]
MVLATLVFAILVAVVHLLPNLYQLVACRVPLGYQDEIPLRDTANYLEIVEKMRRDGFFPSDVSLHEYRDLPVYPQTIFLLPLLLMALPAKLFGGQLLFWLFGFRFILVSGLFSLVVYLVYRLSRHFPLAVFSAVLLFALPVEMIAILFRTGWYDYLAWSKEHLLHAELAFNRYAIPLAAFPFFLAAVYALFRFLEEPENRSRFLTGAISVGSLFYVYPYYISFMGAFLAVLSAVYFVTGERRRAFRTVELGAFSLLTGLPALYTVIRLKREFPAWVAARQSFRPFPLRLTREEINVLIFLAVYTVIHVSISRFKENRWQRDFHYAYLPAFAVVFMADILTGSSVQKEHYPIRILLPWLSLSGAWLLYSLTVSRWRKRYQLTATVVLSGLLVFSMIQRQRQSMIPPRIPAEIKTGRQWLSRHSAPGEVFLSFDYDNIVYFKYHGDLRAYLTGMQNSLAPLTELFDRIGCAFMIAGIKETTPGQYVWRDRAYYNRKRAREGWRKLSYHPWFFGPSQYPRQPELLAWSIRQSHRYYPDQLKRFQENGYYKREVFSRYRLDYLVYTEREKDLGVNTASPYLTEIYSNRLLKIFRVKSVN